MEFRAFDPDIDLKRVLDLVNYDRVAGQIRCTPAMLLSAVAGTSQVDQHLWEGLSPVRTMVADKGYGAIAVVSFATMRATAVGELLWLHAYEQEELVRRCVNLALSEIRAHTVHAFNLSSTLTIGSEGLPLGKRPSTVQVLTQAGFKAQELWSLLIKRLAVGPAETRPDYHSTTIEKSPLGWRISIIDNDVELGHAEVEIIGTTGVIWYVFVDGFARRKGRGSSLLFAAEQLLRKEGATTLLLNVDHGYVDDEWDRSSAVALFRSFGFAEVDRFSSFVLNN